MHRWQARHVVLWLGITIIVLWWRGASFRPAFDIGPGLEKRPPFIPDFFQDWASARNLGEGLPVYAPQEIAAKKYLSFSPEPGDHTFIKWNAHPPPSVLLALPFAAMSFATAFAAWNALSLLMMCVTALVILKSLRVPVCAWDILPALSLLLLCHPFWHQLVHGQQSLLLLFLVTAIWWADREGWSRSAGALLGIATAVKLFPGYLFFYFLLARKWNVILWGLGAFAAAYALAALILGSESVTAFFTEVLPQTARYRNDWHNLSLCGIWGKLFDVGHTHPLMDIHPLFIQPAVALAGMTLTIAAVSACLGWLVTALLRKKDQDAACSLTVIAMLLVSPITWDHYLLVLALPLAILWRRLPPGTICREVLVLLLAILWIEPVYAMGHCLTLLGADRNLQSGRWQIYPLHTLLAVSVPTYALAGVFGLAACTFLRQERKAELPEEELSVPP